MRSTSVTCSVRAVLALLVLGATAATSVSAAKPGKPTRPQAMNLFSSAGYLFQVNRQQCGLLSSGVICAAFQGSPVGGGGYWPKGTPDQYIFWSGLQLAGLVARNSGFPWAGDTIGAFFVDFRGDQVAGTPLTPIYSRLDPADVAAWGTPPTKTVLDPNIYNASLIGRDAISQGDVFVRYWEGDPGKLTGREHPMGIAVDQRILAWNFPSGNEDIIYIVYTFYNVTARASSGKYNNATIPAPLQAEIAAIGDLFQDINENKFKISIPDGGYTIDSLYAAQGMDADVAVFSQNYATAIVPFNLGLEYTGTFLGDVGWQFPPDIFGPPFAAATGFIGIKFLKSPTDATGKEIGLTMFSQELNSATGFPDAFGVRQLYRYLSGFLGPSDNPCNPNDTGVKIRARHYCFLGQVQGDARFIQASGPLSLPPGEARSIVVAYINAAPYNGSGLVVKGATADTKPGTAGVGLTALPGDSIRLIDKIAGWVSHTDANGDGKISQTEVTTVPRSLLDKALVAQAVFDNKFLLPFAPDAPSFFLVPGNNQVTVVWQKSPSEATGDPFFAVASNTSSPLYDPNFRQFDVEGYRIYRGRTSSSLQLVAQFDYAGTSFVDYTGQINYGDRNGDGLTQCAPELGVQQDCPVTFQTTPPFTTSFATALAGNVVQVKVGDRVRLANGGTINLKADTAVVTQQCGTDAKCPPLGDTGVPFAYADRSVRNSFTYFYAVTAFDVNSFKSGPTSLESPRVTKSVTPRVPSGQEVGAGEGPTRLIGGDGSVVDPAAPLPTIAPATGIFSGPMPATNGADIALSAFLPQLLGAATLDVTIDSVITGMAELDVQAGSAQPIIYYLSAKVGGAPLPFKVVLSIGGSSADRSASAPFEATALDGAKAALFGGNQSFSLYGSANLQTSGVWRLTSFGRGAINDDPPSSDFNGPRWWSGATNENTPDPNGLVCSPASGACVQANLSRNAGSITGVDIFHLQAYSTIPNAPGRNLEGVLATVTRAADFRVYWGTAGVIDSVVDVTHRVRVPFSPKIRASWGILTQGSFAGTNQGLTRDGNNNLLTWSDVFCVDPVPKFVAAAAGGTNTNCGGAAQVPAVLQSTATLTPIAFQSSTYDGTAALVTNGNGFIFYLNGHFFLMRMAALPTAGTVWNARFYAGSVTGSAAGGDFAFRGAMRPPAVPGLHLTRAYTGSTFDPTLATELRRVHTVPDPYYVANALELTANQKVLKFVNMPMRAIIRIYSVSGVLVAVIPFDDPTGGGEATWNLRNRNNQFVASGVYFYHIETPGGQTKIGRFTVVNFAP